MSRCLMSTCSPLCVQSIPVVVRRTPWQRAQGFYRLPRAATRKAARQ